MFLNGAIMERRPKLGATGDGEPRFGPSTLAVELPCEVIDPSDHRRVTAQAAGVELVRVLRIHVDAASRLCVGLGDRLRVRMLGNFAAIDGGPLDLDVVALRHLGDAIEIQTGRRIDGAEPGRRP